MRAFRLSVAALAAGLSWSSCAHPPSRAVTPAENVASQLDEADRLVREGCLDCIGEARDIYTRVARTSGAKAASDGLVRTAVLIDLRERELGLLSSDSLQPARLALPATADESLSWSELLDIVGALRLGPDGMRSTADGTLASMLMVASNRERWTTALQQAAPREPAAAYAWLIFACDPVNARSIDVQSARSIVPDAPLFDFGYAASCDREDPGILERLIRGDARFVEANDLLGQAALRVRPQPDVDGADRRFREAYGWRQDWPALTLSIANLALVTEDFDRAASFFDKTLSLKPDDPGALLGIVRALTYQGRYPEAIVAVNRLLATGNRPGEARYWRAFNEHQLKQLDPAWADLQTAGRLMVNADVSKLTGIVAYDRGDLATARRNLEDARMRNPADCETRFYLQLALASEQAWKDTASAGTQATSCFDAEQRRLAQEIAALKSSLGDADRVARQVARRTQQVAVNGRMWATIRFNTAVAFENLGQHEEARSQAATLSDDSVFGERARALMNARQR